jgi:hypothetical protein
MRRFVVEIPVPHSDAVGYERAVRTLWTAASRSHENATTVHLVTVEVAAGLGRLQCVIEAPTIDAVRNLVALAFLSAGRISESAPSDASGVVGAASGAHRHDPGGDLGAGVEPQLVEDVVDVGLDRTLRDE